MSKKPQQTQTTTAPMAFTIDSDVEIPARSRDVPDYGLPAVFDKMKVGQSVLVRFDAVPVEHTRLMVQRYSKRKLANGDVVKTQMVTRTETVGGEKVGLRVFKEGDDVVVKKGD